MTHWNGW